MAKRSEANTFTANNTFTAGQFSVGVFSVNNLSSLIVDVGANAGAWSRHLKFMADSSATGAAYGAYSSSNGSINYAWIGVEDTEYSNAQYKFYPNKLMIPNTWSINDENGKAVLTIQDTSTSTFGRIDGTTYIRGGNTDLYHIKGSTNYKILDESNYSQYLPTTSKWTYGFVTINSKGNNVDFNTVLSGPDSPKILLNYDHELGNDTNAPSGMLYGTVLQIDGNYNSSYNSVALRPQLAFDVNHNVENSTRYMWFRTANNLGYGDSSNWKRVVTADEKPAGYVLDKNSHPALKSIEDGTTLTWLRAPQSGFIPFTAVNIANGGSGSLGTSTWTFKDAYIANVSANRYLFGNTGVDFRLDTNNKIAATISGSARGIEIGDLLVSSNYGADAVKVPTNGIFASGRIQSNDSMLVGYSGNVTEGMLGYGLYYDGTFAQGLGSEYSSGALVLYKMLNPNKGKAGYNVPRAATGTPTYLKITDGTVKLGVGVNKTYTAGEAVTVTEHTLATKSWVTSQGYLKSHQTIYALTFAAGAFAAKTFTPTSAAVTVNVPTKTSHLTNDSGFLTSITKSMVTTALGYTPPTTNTTYSQATSSTLGLVKIGATGLASKNYAVQLNSSGQMYVAVPWTDTNTTYSAATSSTYGLVKIGATGLASKNYAVQLNSSGQMYVAVPWTDTDTNTHYTTRLYVGASGTAATAAASNPYLKVTDDNTYRNQVRFVGAGATTVASDASGNITITSTNTTYSLATSSSNGLMSSSQYTKLSNCIETVSATDMVTSVQVVDTIPASSSQVTGRLYLKFA